MQVKSNINKQEKIVLSSFLTVLASKGFSFTKNLSTEVKSKNRKALKATEKAAKEFLNRNKNK